MKDQRLRVAFFLLVLNFVAIAPCGRAQSAQPVSLVVDATHAPEGIVRTHMVLPVKSGPLTLYYPKWIPGEHGPSGPISSFAGLKISAGGKTIPWERDLLDVFTF